MAKSKNKRGAGLRSLASSMRKKPIEIKPSHKGLLHKDLGVPQGQPIPKAKIAKAAKSKNPALKKRAIFAENFGGK